MTTTGVVLAAGSGVRLGRDTPKQLVPVGGRPMVLWSVAAYANAGIADVLVVTRADLVSRCEALLAESGLDGTVVPGGATRADSTRAALAALGQRPADDLVLVHDAARPLVDPATIAACVKALGGHDAVGVATPSSDTIFEVGDAVIVDIPDRTRLWRAQTPQGFRLDVLRRAHAMAAADPDFEPTDDCGVVARYLPEVRIGVVAGPVTNLKITSEVDLALAEHLLST